MQHCVRMILPLVASSPAFTVSTFFLPAPLLISLPLSHVSRHNCFHLQTHGRLRTCHFIWVLAWLGLFIVCCCMFLMWSSDHCPVCAWLSNVPQLGFFWETHQVRRSSFSVITSNYSKTHLLASWWHQCPYKPQTWGWYTPGAAAWWWGVFPVFVTVSVPHPFVRAASWEQQPCCECEEQWWVRRGIRWLSQNLAALFLGKACFVGHPLLNQRLQAHVTSFLLRPFTRVRFFQYGGEFFSGAYAVTG